MIGYRLIVMSVVGERDGMAIELASNTGEQIAEVFEDDETKLRSLTFYGQDPVPLEVVEWFLAEAADRL